MEPPVQNPEWLELFVNRSQALVDCASDPRAHLSAVGALARLVPPAISSRHELLVRRIFGLLLARFVRVAGIGGEREVGVAFVEFAGADPTPGHWCSDLQAFLHVLDRAVHEQSSVTGASIDPRLSVAMRYIEQHCQDPQLRLRDVARHVQLSESHLVRRLKRQSGYGFTGHLHRVRISRAKFELEHTTSTIKEVAVAVGYENSSHFGRHFKRHVGMTPLAYRQKVQTLASLDLERHVEAALTAIKNRR